jgi:ubiquinone/menaquinone biosynthesis C-methylase UbiE
MVYVSGGNQLLDAKKTLTKIGLESGMRVADLGCGGAGHFIIPAARVVGESGRTYAVDVLRSVLEAVAKKARLMGIHTVRPVWANLEVLGSTKLAANELDRAFLINTLFQSKEHKNILRETYRILKPGGLMLIIDWNDKAKTFGPPLIDRVNANTLQLLAQEQGFKLVEEYNPGRFHFGLIFEK